jgi:hypothetical protein
MGRLQHVDLTSGDNLTVFCSWGDGPDVGINYRYDPSKRQRGSGFFGMDFIGDEAIKIGMALIKCGLQAKDIDLSYANYVINDLQNKEKENEEG